MRVGICFTEENNSGATLFVDMCSLLLKAQLIIVFLLHTVDRMSDKLEFPLCLGTATSIRRWAHWLHS